MQLPANLVLESIEPGKIYFFSKNSEIGVKDHRHIFVACDSNGEHFIFMCGTSNFETVSRFIDRQKLPMTTLVYIRAGTPCFSKDTYLNCNNPKVISKKEFSESYAKGHIQQMGVLSDDHYNKIIRGLMDSRMVSTELKEALPPLVNNISA